MHTPKGTTTRTEKGRGGVQDQGLGERAPTLGNEGKGKENVGQGEELLPTPGWEKELPTEKTKGQAKEKTMEGPKRELTKDNRRKKGRQPAQL